MQKNLLFSLLFLLCFYKGVEAQINKKETSHNGFDEKAAWQLAKAKGIKSSDLEGYVQFLKNDFSSKKALEKQAHRHTPYENGSKDVQETIIYLSPNRTMGLGCPNMGFEQYNFNGWTGETGTVSDGTTPGGNPLFTSTGGAIINTAGNNVSVLNTINYHTLMSVPATSNIYPNCTSFGYDSLACKAIGSQTISEVPFISPYSFDGVSVRLNSANPDYRAARLKYITTTSSTNSRLSFSYALVVNDPATLHDTVESPYFNIIVKNETTGTLLPGCTSYTFNVKTAKPSDSLKTSVTSYLDVVKYKKWQYYSIDLSTLPSGTSVSINFEVGGCSQGGHFGYAYVDAECGGIGTTSANMCTGTNFATLVAPTGFSSYQWYDSSGLISGATNDTLIVNPATVGNTYSVNLTSPGGCALTQTVSIALTTVNIINLDATSSCAGGNSGSASVEANGSNGVYTYSWTNTTLGDPNYGLIVSTSQVATGLSPGTYSVLVASSTCGQRSANLSVGVTPPFFSSQIRPFCGNATTIIQPGGSNYMWYKGTSLIAAPNGNNDTLFIDQPRINEVYTLVYKNPQGCRDSIRYTLSLLPGGSSYFSNITNVCDNNSNGSVVLNLNTPYNAPYNYLFMGPAAATTASNTSTSASSITISALAAGTYTAIINDGFCIYNNTVSIGVVQTNFTVTPKDTFLCFPEEALLNLNFGNLTPASCSLSNDFSCSSQNLVPVGTGTFENTSTSNPSPYGNYYKNSREQYLFTASELQSAGLKPGNISSLTFYVNSILPLNTSGTSDISTYIGTLPNYSIKMKCTSANALPNFDNTGLSQVYFGDFTPRAGSNTHNFVQPYAWDGVSSLIVDVCYTRTTSISSSYYTSNPISPSTNTGTIKTVYFNSDVTLACGNLNGTTSANRPNISFGNCPAIDPSTYTVSISPNGTITSTYPTNDSIKVAPTFTNPPTGAGSVIYTVSVINPIGGCAATRTVEIIYPPLATTIIAVASSSTICDGSSTILSATGAATYNWYYYQSGILTPLSTSPTITVVPTAIGINTYVVTGAALCQGSSTDTTTVTVNVIPNTSLLIVPLADITKCLNKTTVLTPSVSSTNAGNSGEPYSYSWTTLPGNNPASGINTLQSYTASSNSTETLVVTVNGVCSSSASETVTVTNFADNLTVAISNSFITCPNKPLILNSITSGGRPTYNYYWSVNSTTVSNLPALNYTSPSTGGTYTVGLTVIDSCSYERFDSEVIFVLPNTLTVNILGSVEVCGNTPFTLNSTVSGGYSTNYSYLWSLNSDMISSNQNLSYITPAAEGTYTVLLTASDSCGYEGTDYEIINVLPPCMVNIPNVITPNGDGANDFFKLGNLEYHPNTSVVIFDRWGIKVYENPNYNNEWKADGNSDGTYFYIISVPDDKKYTGFVTVFKGK